jgi:hypothetical protein
VRPWTCAKTIRHELGRPVERAAADHVALDFPRPGKDRALRRLRGKRMKL